MSFSVRITHEDKDSDRSAKVFMQGPEGSPVISFIQPGESAVFEIADCNELHCVDWAAEPKPLSQNPEDQP